MVETLVRREWAIWMNANRPKETRKENVSEQKCNHHHPVVGVVHLPELSF